LRNVALDLLAAGDPSAGEALAREQVETAANMTDRIAALATLARLPGEARESALGSFAERYRDEPLILDKWFGLQATIPEAGTLDRVRRLMAHPAFSLTNPNRVRSLVGSFALGNPTQFHRPDGAGYDFLAGLALELDGANPQLAARLVTAFGRGRSWSRAAAARPRRRSSASPKRRGSRPTWATSCSARSPERPSRPSVSRPSFEPASRRQQVATKLFRRCRPAGQSTHNVL
jgi:aminopeptidase N